MLNKIIISGLILMSLINCKPCDRDDPSNCQQFVEVNEEQFENAPEWNITVLESEIEGDCLRIKFGTSGCSDEGWDVRLIDSEQVLFSLPPKRNLRLSLKGTGLCDAYFTREITFDISPLQIDSENSINLELTNSGTVILYNYL